MIVRRLKSLLLVAVLLCAGLAGLAYAFLYASVFNDWRQNKAAAVLGEILGRRVAVEGSVEVALGVDVRVRVSTFSTSLMTGARKGRSTG